MTRWLSIRVGCAWSFFSFSDEKWVWRWVGRYAAYPLDPLRRPT
ncbi:MAG TPA: hypothetical protein VF682_13590 [Pseudomonas sp.]|jgi:hypothetical protein